MWKLVFLVFQHKLMDSCVHLLLSFGWKVCFINAFADEVEELQVFMNFLCTCWAAFQDVVVRRLRFITILCNITIYVCVGSIFVYIMMRVLSFMLADTSWFAQYAIYRLSFRVVHWCTIIITFVLSFVCRYIWQGGQTTVTLKVWLLV